MSLPDIRELLPSKAAEVLTAYLFKRIDESKLNTYNEPTYRLSDALRENNNDVPFTFVSKCFDIAQSQFEKLHLYDYLNKKT